MPGRAPSKLRPLLILWLASLCVAALLQIPLAWGLAYVSRSITFAEVPIDLLAPADLDTDTETISIFSYSFPGVRSITIMANPPGTMSRRYLEHHTFAPNSREIIATTAPWPPADVHPALASASAWPPRTGVYSRPNMSHHVPLTSRHAAGWPFLCVEGRIEFTRSNTSSLTPRTFGIATDPRLFPSSGVGYLVYYPRWPAYLANTLIDGPILAAAILLSTLLFRTLRARRRRREGLCPNCAYDLHATPPNTPCPECGRPR